MRTFFLQMFLSFWVSTIAIFWVATTLNPDGHYGTFENIHESAIQDAAQLGSMMTVDLGRGDCTKVAEAGKSYSVADHNGVALCGGERTEQMESLARRALKDQEPSGEHVGTDWITATPFANGGESYVLLHRVEYRGKSFFPHLPPVALPVSLIVTFLFAFLLTRPVRQLSHAFERFAEGDLTVRLPALRRPWRVLGGSDVRSLMLDFNSMADKIGSLIAGQKMLVRDISHELRSPLARLRLALEMARDEPKDTAAYLDQMELEAERVNDLIGQMLTLSLLESAGEIVHKEPVGIVELVESMVPDLTFEAASRGCAIQLERPMDEVFVDGNAELLRRAVENVVRNAIRFTAPSSEVAIVITETTEAARSVKIEITDHGPGVPEESLSQLFQAFYRTDSARRDSTGGFGVGLSIAERAVALHGGTITARNGVERGLAVSICLPCLNAQPQDRALLV